MDKLSYNLKVSECMPLCIQTKNRIFYLDYLGKTLKSSLDIRIQQLRMRIENTDQKKR